MMRALIGLLSLGAGCFVPPTCPLAEGPPQDEDRDGLADSCDPCPPHGDPDADADADGDGVGDACDPNPSTPGDRIVVFEGFHGGVPASWNRPGTWMAAGDDVVISADNDTFRWLSLETQSVKQTVTASVTIAGTNSGSFQMVGVVDNQRPGSDSAIACGVYTSTSSALPALTGSSPGLGLYDPNDLGNAEATAYEMDLATYRISMTRDGTSYTCAVDGSSARSLQGASTLSNTPHQAGVIVINAAARYHWLMVVESP